MKETHEAFLMARKCYKKFLRVYYSIEKRNKEKQTIFLQFFTEAKKDSENYSVRLIRDSKSGHYECNYHYFNVFSLQMALLCTKLYNYLFQC